MGVTHRFWKFFFTLPTFGHRTLLIIITTFEIIFLSPVINQVFHSVETMLQRLYNHSFFVAFQLRRTRQKCKLPPSTINFWLKSNENDEIKNRAKISKKCWFYYKSLFFEKKQLRKRFQMRVNPLTWDKLWSKNVANNV